ncbi:hypothetical protein [Paracoccus ravus]|uniref:hypothetical protein n=1 Tax=Paracoccus ravus TaxID=2447760 RepID=UPI00106ECEDB|nr:hypothetical protein [Paracoccus ravus]
MEWLVKFLLLSLFMLSALVIATRAIGKQRTTGPESPGISLGGKEVSEKHAEVSVDALSGRALDGFTGQLQITQEEKNVADPVFRLRDLMKERKTESLQLLSGWIKRSEEIS